MASEFHEPPDELSESTRSFRRALNSLMEELEAIDWYQQRMDVTKDKQLYEVLNHNRKDEMEHASMMLEWIRRNMDGWDEKLKKYLFTDGDITSLGKGSSAPSNELDIGKIKDK